MTPSEERTEQIKNNIADAKKELKAQNQTGPLVLGILGIAVMLISLLYTSVFGLGFLVVVLAMVWSISRLYKSKKLKAEILRYEQDLYSQK
jgi:hypothetical protein